MLAVAEGVQAGHQAAHTGPADHIDRDSQLFHITQYAKVR